MTATRIPLRSSQELECLDPGCDGEVLMRSGAPSMWHCSRDAMHLLGFPALKPPKGARR